MIETGLKLSVYVASILVSAGMSNIAVVPALCPCKFLFFVGVQAWLLSILLLASFPDRPLRLTSNNLAVIIASTLAVAGSFAITGTSDNNANL
jgi:hypothetical protein